MSHREQLYLHLPIQMQNLLCSLEGFRIQHSRYNAEFFDILRQVEKRTFISREEILILSNTRLQSFIEHAATTVPYYRDLFRKIGVQPKDIRSSHDLVHLPILNKSDVQSDPGRFLSNVVSPKLHVRAHTSGTTGAGLKFVTTMKSIHEQWAVWWRYRRWHGIEFNTWSGHFGGRSVVPIEQKDPPYWRYNVPGRQILFSAYHMSPQNMKCYVDELKRAKLKWLHGYPSTLALLATYILENRIELGYQVSKITCGAENLLQHQYQLITAAFGKAPIQHYGLSEAVANISQCLEGHLHVDEDFSTVEFVFDSQIHSHRVIGTNFTNFAMPLIRYDCGDQAVIDDSTCTCGRPGRCVYSLDGRQEDYIVLHDGAKLGRMDHIFKDMVNIREAQLYQSIPGEVVIKIVKTPKYTDRDEKRLLDEAHQRLGEDTRLELNYVTELTRSRTGKLRFVVSDIKPEL